MENVRADSIAGLGGMIMDDEDNFMGMDFSSKWNIILVKALWLFEMEDGYWWEIRGSLRTLVDAEGLNCLILFVLGRFRENSMVYTDARRTRACGDHIDPRWVKIRGPLVLGKGFALLSCACVTCRSKLRESV